MPLRVLVTDPISEQGLAVLRQDGEIHVDVATGLSEEELCRRIGEYDGLIVRSGTQVGARVLAAAGRLRAIGRAGVGVDNIDVQEATRRGILVLNTPQGNTIAAAEHALALLLALCRKIPQAHHSLARERRWERGRFLGVQVAGKVLGLVGLGRIGAEVARRAAGLEMRVLAYDPFVSEERARRLGVELADLEELCRRADFISIHAPRTKATEGLLGREAFGWMKPGVRIVNCARGGIVDEQALLAALEEGRVAGAALDVFTTEPPLDSPLLGREDVVVTPHLGASTEEAQVSVAVDVARELVRALRGTPVATAVNVPELAGDHLEELAPYLDLAERLGRLYTELLDGGQGRVEIVYSGQVAAYEGGALTRAVLTGMLNPVLHEAVNYVNAPLVAKEREIGVVEVREERADDFAGLITLRAPSPEGRPRYVAGTLTGERAPTLVMIDGYRVNVDTPGRLLVAYNQDRPGMIGKVGTILGESGINIAYMQVGRKAVGGYAVMVLGIDDPIPDEVLGRIAALPELRDTRLVEW